MRRFTKDLKTSKIIEGIAVLPTTPEKQLHRPLPETDMNIQTMLYCTNNEANHHAAVDSSRSMIAKNLFNDTVVYLI